MKLDIKNRTEFGIVLNKMRLCGYGAEVGVAYGENAKSILDKWSGNGIILIDPYKKWEPDEYIDGTSVIDFDKCLEYAKALLKKHDDRIIWRRQTSDEAYAGGLPKLDWVYLDGNHHQPQIGRDLENYWNVVRRGGVFAGHDYYNLDTKEYRCEVKDAVDAFVVKYGLDLHTTECTSWWIVKPE